MSEPHRPENWPGFTPDQFECFSALIREKTGLTFDRRKMNLLDGTVRQRMADLNLRAFSDYCRRVQAGSPRPGELEDFPAPPPGPGLSREMRRLAEALANNETAFFRNREHFRVIAEDILPELLNRNRATRRLRLWSAGCSTGQEAYSLAIAVREALEAARQPLAAWKIEIIASDISEKALRQAAQGRYRREELRGLSPERSAKYFRPLSSGPVISAPLGPANLPLPGRPVVEVCPEIRETVRFYFFNLAAPAYPAALLGDFDLVVCENVTIYFHPEVTRRVIDNIYGTMREGAYLFLGYSETLWQVTDKFRPIHAPDTFYYQKPFPAGPRFSGLPKPAHANRRLSQAPPGPPGEEAGPGWQELLAAGKQKAAGHDFEQARQILEKALAAAPQEVAVICALAGIKLKLGDYGAAGELCRRAVALDPLAEEAHLMLAMLHSRAERSEEAIAEFKQTIYINPNSVLAYLRLADIYRDSGRPREALREYRRALAILRQKPAGELVEDIPASLIRQACEQNITRLT